ncbi:M48 family metallopeptidase [Photobacterium lutimaris]|uniref:Uncharacterized protein n=1 Tax=Photobacterium lutimaris TaxID=388278 RepID=A0A2T3IRF4_9GAMM|nr:M48 family metallopeptidase [Photobacterium lutimaris]PSU30936.1 hypothetical protein C9I99_23010 [Photobacterium lutimaris]TDR72171.1 peptidase M48-like protein [Photobacterium lutimaris]
MIVSGICYLPRSSKRQNASIQFLPSDRIRLVSEQEQHEWLLSELTLSEPLGSVPRKVIFPDGTQFIADDQRVLDGWLWSGKGSWLNRVEQNTPMIAASLAAIVVVCVLLFSHGVPWLTGALVRVMPEQVSHAVGEHVLATLDDHLLEPTALSRSQQVAINTRFEQVVIALPSLSVQPRLIFRRWGNGPNAIALSDGTVIVFDSLVELAETPEQLDSVILHELGHIQHQHVMKSLVRSTLLSAAVAVMTGESTGLIDVFSGVGVFLVTQGYSRDAEEEADQFAAEQMLHLHGSVAPMQQMYELLKATAGEGDLPQWLSTHPKLEERIKVIAQ